MCPVMPYHDPDREYVNGWFASPEGPDGRRCNRTRREANPDQLEAEGGACIMYTHFAREFRDGTRLDPTFERLMKRLSQNNGWFVPVATLFDFLKERQGGVYPLSKSECRRLERRWLARKFQVGGSS